MKNGWILAAGLALSSGFARSDSEGPVRLLAAGEPPDVQSTIVERFNDEDADIRFTLVTADARQILVWTDVFLDGGALGAPLARGLRCELQRDGSFPTLVKGRLTVQPPDTKKPVQLRLILNAAPMEGVPGSTFGSIRLRFTPKDDLKEALQRFLKGTGRAKPPSLLVFGATKGFRELLQNWKIGFDDGTCDAPTKITADTLAVGDVAADTFTDAPRLATGSRLLLLRRAKGDHVEVREKTTQQTELVISGSNGHDDWRHTPFLHRLLIELINHPIDDHE